MQPTIFDQVLSTVGAVLVLGAYVANLGHRLDRDGATYAATNFAGATLLAYVAYHSGAIGLILVEVAWSLVRPHRARALGRKTENRRVSSGNRLSA